MRFHRFLAFVASACLIGLSADAQSFKDDCGNVTRCEIDNGYYHAALPDTVKGAPVLLWLHGHGGRADRAARPQGMARAYTSQGFIFVAPQGIPNPRTPNRRDWNVNDGHEEPRDDVAFLKAVLDDVASRFGASSSRVLLAGFSRGASMAWDFACAAPERITAMAVAAGGFWEPMKPECAGPVHLFHTHGFSDSTVPFEGRQVSWKGRAFHQGNIMKGLDIWREVNGCTGAAEVNLVAGTRKDAPKGGHWEKLWTECESGSVRLQITPIGHGIPKGWSADVLNWFSGIPKTRG